MMSKFAQIFIFLFGMLSPLLVAAENAEVKAGAAVSIEQDQDLWAGQQVTLNLDLKTTGFSFSNSHFNLPEISGAFLMQTDSTTIKMTEKTDGQDWQIVRYPLALYPQKSGQLEIPPISVRFTTSAGFGSPEKAFEFETRALELTVRLPPGVKAGELVVTTSSFELEHEWQPFSGATKTGDAFTLKVSRLAGDISAMLLPPLPVFRTDGLAAYPQAPEVSDKTDRGDLTGVRTDSITWVVEKPGAYEIPGIRFQWWDPLSLELKQQVIPGLSMDIAAAASDETPATTAMESEQKSSLMLYLLILVITVLSVYALWLGLRRGRLDQYPDHEKTTFTRLEQACKNGQAGQTYSAIHAWLEFSSPAATDNSHTLTLNDFASGWGDRQLAAELKNLQTALVSSAREWQGDTLLSSLQRIRRKINQQKAGQSKAHLVPLNPPPSA